MPTLQSEHQYRQDDWMSNFGEEGHGVASKRKKRRKTQRARHSLQCKQCKRQFASESKRQPYCSSKCYGIASSLKKTNPLSKTECIRCLASLGFGCKTISKKFYKIKHTTMRNWIRNMGIAASSSKIAATRMVYSSIPQKVNLQKRRKIIEQQKAIKRIERKIKHAKVWVRKIQAAIKNYGPEFNWRTASKAEINYWANINERRKQSRESSRKKWRTNLNVRIKGKLRNHINRMIRMAKQKKNRRKVTMFLGVSIEDAKQRIESKFRDGMTWDNHGELWEIDHIVPLSHFNLNNEYQLLMANHITNLQPLLKKENRKKSNNFYGVHQFEIL